ncbi:DUF4189 domain-containing protein [Nocardia sp. NPDC051463]|uniref:DUF4189 domain-containing protein n=1 Tax=Nocardia sp. NPDC051463 TaxID=3154845 RepID=UPI00344C32DA
MGARRRPPPERQHAPGQPFPDEPERDPVRRSARAEQLDEQGELLDENDGATGFVVVFGSILVGVLAITAIIGVREYNEQADIKATGAGANQTTTPAAPTSDKPVAPAAATTTSVPNTDDRWIAATYNAQTDKVSWVRSQVSGEAAAQEAEAACGTGCPPARWSRNGCVSLVIGETDGWGSERGDTIAEAESKAISNAETVYGISGPFSLWTKCALE